MLIMYALYPYIVVNIKINGIANVLTLETLCYGFLYKRRPFGYTHQHL